MQTADDARPLLTPAQAADRLGVHPATLRALVAREGLPAIRLRGGHGRRRLLRFEAAALDRWLRSRYLGRSERSVESGEARP